MSKPTKIDFVCEGFKPKQDLSRKRSAWKDFGLLFWSILLQSKSKVCGLRWGGMDELEVASVALDIGTYKSLDS